MFIRKRILGVALLATVAVIGKVDHAHADNPCPELLLTEFMASNSGTLRDEDGAYSDWIEVYNPCTPNMDLAGWYLTDDPADRTKWQFPAVSLARGEFMVIFASDKNRAVAGAELHTNFKLSADGDYLALVKPDGLSVAHEYSPEYPEQFTDVSYGLVQSATTLVSHGDDVSYHVPTIDDASLGTAWTTSGFDDSSWDIGPSGIGFINSAYSEFEVTYFKANISVGSLTTAEDVITNPAVQATVVSESASVINFLNTGSGAHFGNDSPFPGTTIGSDVNHFVVLVTGTVLIPEAGDWTFGVNSDDGFGFELTDGTESFAFSYPNPRGPADTLAAFTISEAGPYVLRLVFYERAGGSELELFAAREAWSSFNSSAFHLVGDTASGGLPVVGFGDDIGTDVQAAMEGINSSLWMRMEFDVTDPSMLGLLTLESKYEDGLVAYLNGQEVASPNAPVPVQWDSQALSDRPVEEASLFERIDVTDAVSALQAGANVLAIHALNDSASDRDFLNLPQLVASAGPIDPVERRYFTVPTAGTYNNEGFAGFSGSPQFSHSSGVFTDSFTLAVTADEPAAVIRYTVDGSEPSETNGIEYTAPVSITTTVHVRARVFEPDLAPGPTVSRMFVGLDPDVQSFDSNLPIVVVDTFGQGVNQDWQTSIFGSVIDTTEGRASITDTPDFSGRAGLRIRGSSSTSFPKKQYFFETWDEHGEDLNVSFLGFPSETDWVLNGPYSDKALMRNVLSYKWSNDIGRYAPRTRFVEMFLNSGGGAVSSSDYVGLYVVIEKVKRDSNRVDVVKLDPTDNQEPEITGGYIIKKDRLDPGDSGFYTSIGQRFAYVEPKEDEITIEQAGYIKGYIDEFETVLYDPGYDDPVDGYAKYIDVDSFVDHHILVEMTKNIDGFRLSTFWHKNRGGKLTMGPIWDYNLSLGNANYLEGWLANGWYGEMLSETNYPWWRRLFEDIEFQVRYADRWSAWRRRELATDRLLADIDEYALLLEEAQARNFVRWPVLGSYVWPNWFIADTFQEEIDWMKQWLADRLTWIDSQFLAPPTFSQQGGLIPLGSYLLMDAPAGTIYYTLDGSDPRLPGGDVAPGASPYTGALRLVDNTTVRARVLDNGAWGALNEADFLPFAGLFVNEVLPVNTAVNADEEGEFEPWVEIYNSSTTTVNLSGMFLSDDDSHPSKWEIPIGATVCGRDWIVFWADDEPGDGSLHASFRLNAAGGEVHLFTPSGVLVDSMEYGVLPENVSRGRSPDGDILLRDITTPTPGAANSTDATRMFLNEYNAVASHQFLENNGSDSFWGRLLGNGGDWFELVVVSDHLDVRGWELVVSNYTGDPNNETIQTLTLTRDRIWKDLRSGTIITVSEALPSDVSYDPASGDWWINVQAADVADGTYITASDFEVSNVAWQLTVFDELGSIAFGPAGEGINPTSGVGNDEVFKLEENPNSSITQFSNYNDGSSSTFGAPNIWGAGTVTQDFSMLHSVVSCATDSECDDANPCTDDICDVGICESVSNTVPCDDGDPCTDADTCAGGICSGAQVFECCHSECECDDGNPCTFDSCVSHACVNNPAEVCVQLVALAAPSAGDTLVTLPTSGLDLAPGTSFYVEAWSQCTEPTGLSSVTFDLEFSPTMLTATNIVNSTMFGEFPTGQINSSDGLVNDLGGSHHCVEPPCSDAVGYEPHWARVAVVEMQANEQGLARIRSFDAGSSIYGIAICGSLGNLSPLDVSFDEIVLLVDECLNDDLCDDGNPCTDDTCVDNECVFTPNDTNSCSDGTFCNGTEACIAGVCTDSVDPCIDLAHCDEGNDVCLACLADVECDDDNLCTDDTCMDNECAFTSNDANSCDDDLFCNGAEVCSDGACTDGVDPCVDVAHCDEVNEVCLACIADGECDDGNPCTDDACVDNECVLTVDDTNPCDDDAFCDGIETCLGGICTDGLDPCVDVAHCDEVTDVCFACIADGECDDGNPCTDDACVDNECVFAPDDSNTCEDGVFCNGAESCVAGACTDSIDPCVDLAHCDEDDDLCLTCLADDECDDGNPCTDNECVDNECVFTSNDSNSCEDGAFCNGAESCVAGLCTDGPDPCVDLAHCNETNDECLICIVDGDCSDANPCTDDTCVVNDCIFTADDANACEDGEFCNGAATCVSGSCTDGIDPCLDLLHCDEVNDQCLSCIANDECDDANPCTDDACVDNTCENLSDDSNSCDDGEFCNGAESCSGSVCIAGFEPCVDLPHCDEANDDCLVCIGDGECDDGNPCTDDACVNNDCENMSDDSNSCDDGEFCNGAEVCAIGVCEDGPEPCVDLAHCDEAGDECLACIADGDCDDLSKCTDDACIDNECVFEPNDSNSCDDGLFCNGDETCQGGICVDGVDPCVDLAHCDESNEWCLLCIADGECGDGISCTADACVDNDCVSMPDDDKCDNGLFCDGDETCSTVAGCLEGSVPCVDPCEHCDEDSDRCAWCVFDLNQTTFVDGLDFAVFAGCFGGCYAPGEPCSCTNFDADPGGCVGGSDFGAFSACFGLACADCATCSGPPTLRNRTAIASEPVEASVQLVAVSEPTLVDVTEVLPRSMRRLVVDRDFHIEVWIRRDNSFRHADVGFASAYVSLSYDPSIVTVHEIISTELFGTLPHGVVAQSMGWLHAVGGCAELGEHRVGLNWTWNRVATLRVRADTPGLVQVRAEPSYDLYGISLFGAFDSLSESQIEFHDLDLKIYTEREPGVKPARRARLRGEP